MRTPPPCASAPLPAFGVLIACLSLFAIALPAGASAASSEPPRVVRDVRVTTIDDARVTVDLWGMQARRERRAATPRPIALLVHGGGWHSGDKRQWEQSRWAQRLVKRGWLVVNANYRLACTARAAVRDGEVRDARLCGHAMRTSIADVRATLRYTARSATRWGGDPRRIVLFGASAGGQLALLAGSDPARPAGVRGIVAIGPPTDLTWVGARPELPIHSSAVKSIGCALDACAGSWSESSPIRRVRRGTTPPTWIFNAGADPITPLEPMRAYVDLLHASGVPAALLTTANAAATCHGVIPCADEPLLGTELDMFEHALTWVTPRVR